MVAQTMVTNAGVERLRQAAELLELALPAAPDPWVSWSPEGRRYEEALHQAVIGAVAKGRASALKVAGLLALLAVERRIEGGEWRGVEEHFRILERAGHKLCPAERDRLRQPPTIEDEERLLEEAEQAHELEAEEAA